MYDNEELYESKKRELINKEQRTVAFLLIVEIFSISASFFSVYVATVLNVSNLSLQNGSMLLVLTMLLTVFLIVKSFNYLFEERKNLFYMGISFVIIGIIVFIFKVIEFISIPLPLII